MDKLWDDSNWRQEYKELKRLSKFQLEILENGPRSLSQSWILGAMHGEWRKMKGYKYPDPPDCSSSFKEFNKMVKENFEHPPEEFGPGGPLTDQAGSGTH
tara:strand:+ start:238 stop:537 length:300 start_codon:yes stop_codon:yes gene_type:complete